jgi:hypothetical protein
MPVGAYSPDEMTRIVNVHWGESKAVFIIGTTKGTLYYSPGTTGKEDKIVLQTIKIPISSNDDYFRIRGSSFAMLDTEPVFLICGQFAEFAALPGEPQLQFPAFICLSNDGLDWEKVYQGPTGTSAAFDNVLPWSSDSFALVRKDGAFYFDLWLDKTPPFSASALSEQTFTSTSGSTWSGPIENRDISAGTGTSAFPTSYCIDNDCFDVLRQHVPDGVMHDDEVAHLLIRPRDPPAIDYNGNPNNIAYWSPINAVEIVRPSEPPTVVTVPGLAQVTCVAGNGSVWMAGGWNDEDGNTGAVVMSVDGGETWTSVTAVDGGVVTLTAAPAPEPDARL